MQQRVEMASWLLKHTRIINNVWWPGDAHFWLNEYVSSRNAVHWCFERLNEVSQKLLHSQKVTVWLATYRGKGAIGQFLKKMVIPLQLIANATSKWLWKSSLLNFYDDRMYLSMQRVWFQQDGATPHTLEMALNWLNDHFGTPVISLNTRHVWAPNSPNLNPLDFFVWDCIKDRAYEDSPRTLDDLIAAILCVSSNMTLEDCNAAILNIRYVRLPQVINHNGAHFEYLL